MRLLTYNIWNGGVGREADLLEVLRAADADVIVAPEVRSPEVLAGLGGALGMSHRAPKGRSWTRKVGLLSRLPVASFETFGLRKPGFHAEIELRDSRRLTLYGSWPCEWSRAGQVAALLRHTRAAKPGPHVIAGDLNAIAPGDPERLEAAPLWVRAQLWPQAGRVLRYALVPLLEAGYVDCFRALHPNDHGFTLPPRDPTVRLDYVLADPAAAAGLRRCEVVRGPDAVQRASDHLPVLAEFD